MIRHQLGRAYVVFVDIQCSLVKYDEPGVLHNHVASPECFVCNYDPNQNILWSYVGEDCKTAHANRITQTSWLMRA